MNNFSDFHTVKDLKFDVQELEKALKQVLKIKNYDNANGIKNFAAICLNQIPGKPESTQGNYARGIYWTKPDHHGKEIARDKELDENLINCSLFWSLSDKHNSLFMHRDAESVLLIQGYGEIAYVLSNEEANENRVIHVKTGDVLLLPRLLPHKSIPLEPRVTLSIGATPSKSALIQSPTQPPSPPFSRNIL